jgi:hypothetical protein
LIAFTENVFASFYRELFELRAQLQELKMAVELRSISLPELEEITDRPKGGPMRTDTLISINGTDGMLPSCGSGGGGGGLLSDECSVPCSEDKESIESDPSQVFYPSITIKELKKFNKLFS